MYKNIILGFEFEVETNNIHETYNFIDEISSITRYTEHRIYKYHESADRTVEGKWRVEEDSSILGAEFISPPIPYIEAKKMVAQLFKIMEHSDNIMITNNCGLHVGMSIDETVENLDLSNFLVSLDQEYIAALWPQRIKNKYVRNIGTQLRSFPRRLLDDIDTKNIAKHILCSYHSFISLKEFNFEKYLEIRIAGGKDYHKKFEKLFALIDHVASNMLSNNLSTSRTTDKKCTKKMISYVNRALTSNHNPDKFSFSIMTKKLNSGTIFSPYAIERILNSAIITAKYGIYTRNIQERLDRSLYIYSLIKYCIIHKEDYNVKSVRNFIEHFLELMKHSEFQINIQKKESILNKVKLIRQWKRLPTYLLIDLLASINSRHAHKYLVKYVPNGVLHAILSDSKGILKRNAITHVFKYNKVN